MFLRRYPQNNNPGVLQRKKIRGLGGIAAALPAMAMGGFKYAAPLMGYGLFQLFKARKLENKPQPQAQQQNLVAGMQAVAPILNFGLQYLFKTHQKQHGQNATNAATKRQQLLAPYAAKLNLHKLRP